MNGAESDRPDVVVRHVTHKGNRRWAALGLFLSELDKELAYSTGVRYRGHNITLKDDGFLLTIKGEEKGKQVVGFIGGSNLLECYRNLWKLISQDQIRWMGDRFAK